MRGVLAFLLLTVPLFAPQASQETSTGSIEGIVFNVVTNLPIEDASVSLRSSNRRSSFRAGIENVITGADGKFVFTGLKAGEYFLEILSNGYARMQYGQKTFPGDGAPIQLTAGQAVKELNVLMTPTGTISGRIREKETRNPVADVLVQLMRFEYTSVGHRYFEPAGSARSNDRGEYRLYFVTPGRYYVHVGGIRPGELGFPRQNNSSVIPASYSPVYYPGVAKTEDAVIITVKPGVEVGGIDVSMGGRESLYRIRGRVVVSNTGQSPENAQMKLYSRSDGRWEPVPDVFMRYRPDGTFEFPPVIPGSYSVTADASSSGFATAVKSVEIVDADVDALVISVGSGVSVAGKIAFEGRPPSAAELKELYLNAASPDRMVSRGSLVTPLTNEEAAFHFDHLAAGEYRLSWNLPKGFYVKQARFGGLDVLRNPLQVSEREASGLQLVISSNVAALEGSVSNDRLEIVPGSLVVLVPDRRDRDELFQETIADGNGHYSFDSVSPGNYSVISWEALQRFGYFDPDVLAQVDQKGRPVQLTESSKQSLNVTVIPTNN
jgi:hypothetical protein